MCASAAAAVVFNLQSHHPLVVLDVSLLFFPENSRLYGKLPSVSQWSLLHVGIVEQVSPVAPPKERSKIRVTRSKQRRVQYMVCVTRHSKVDSSTVKLSSVLTRRVSHFPSISATSLRWTASNYQFCPCTRNQLSIFSLDCAHGSSRSREHERRLATNTFRRLCVCKKLPLTIYGFHTGQATYQAVPFERIVHLLLNSST